jgi:hypothetical protein
MGAVAAKPGIEVRVSVYLRWQRGNSDEFFDYRGGQGRGGGPVVWRGRTAAGAPSQPWAGGGRSQKGGPPEDGDEISSRRRKRKAGRKTSRG